MMGLAPAIAAAPMADNPTPPAPNTATDWPSPTFAVCSTAPAPVNTAQPTRQVISVGSDGDIGTTFSANVTMCSLQVYTSPSATTGRPRKVAPVGLETGNPLMGIRGTTCSNDVIAFFYAGDFLPHVCNDAAALMPRPIR